jgi:hypothetical protein
MEVKNDTTNATSGGTHMAVSMPAVEKYITVSLITAMPWRAQQMMKVYQLKT